MTALPTINTGITVGLDSEAIGTPYWGSVDRRRQDRSRLAKIGGENGPPHVLTISLEEFFQAQAFREVISPAEWYRFESRLESSTARVLDLCDDFGVSATFFVPGCLAEQHSDLIAEIARRGHELASSGYDFRDPSSLDPAEFRRSLARSRELIEAASGRPVLGYRAPDGHRSAQVAWIAEILAAEGYLYDATSQKLPTHAPDKLGNQVSGRLEATVQDLVNLPVSAWDALGLKFPIGDVSWLRRAPSWMSSRATVYWLRRLERPLVLHLRVWELDVDQPQLSTATASARTAHYRNLNKVRGILAAHFARHQFGSIASHLKVDFEPAVARAVAPTTETVSENGAAWQRTVASSERQLQAVGSGIAADAQLTEQAKVPVSIVVPCYNEAGVISYLAKTLASVEVTLAEKFIPQFVFVDDCSRDETWQELNDSFGAKANCTLVRHEQNQGVAQAILTGIRAAKTEVVCSIDCDCSYDPHELQNMIPLLAEGVDLVTASPYHPDGCVRNVPGWRLMLSKSLSLLYRHVLSQKLSTYTSCFRVYRKSAITSFQLTERGFLGVAELVGQLSLAGRQIVEYPATLSIRVLGESKMKISRTVVGHLRLLTSLVIQRIFQSSCAHSAPPAASGRCSASM